MCSSPKAPTPPPRLPEAPTPPSAGASGAAANNRKKRTQSSSTILTGPQGVTDQANTAQKTLLGA